MSQLQKNGNEILKDKDVAIFALDITIWTGSKSILRSDDIRRLSTGIPKSIMSGLKSQEIFDTNALNQFQRLRRQAESACLQYGGKLIKSLIYVPVQHVEEVHLELEEIVVKFNKALDLFVDNYDEKLEEWLSQKEAELSDYPEWFDIFKKSVMNKHDVRKKITIDYEVFYVNSFNSIPALNKKLVKRISSLSDVLFRNISNKAKSTMNESFKGKVEVTQRAVRPFRDMKQKLISNRLFDFSRVDSLVEQIDIVLDNLPKAGKIDGNNFNSLVNLLGLLINCSQDGAQATPTVPVQSGNVLSMPSSSVAVSLGQPDQNATIPQTSLNQSDLNFSNDVETVSDAPDSSAQPVATFTF